MLDAFSYGAPIVRVLTLLSVAIIIMKILIVMTSICSLIGLVWLCDCGVT